MEETRALVLEHFNGSPEEWSVVFTAGATAALKLAAEAFLWREHGRLVYAHNSHTSVLGMRELARGLGAGGFACLAPGLQYGAAEGLARGVEAAIGAEAEAEADAGAQQQQQQQQQQQHHLLVLPAECNFSGRKLDLGTLGLALSLLEGKKEEDERQQRVSVLLDAAKLVGTARLDLGALPWGVEMVCLSFYKMFGYPSGIGCLLLRHTAPWLQRQDQDGSGRGRRRRYYFGGGTVLAALPQRDFVRLHPEPAHRLADGTQDYLGIVAVAEGLRTLRSLGGGDGAGSSTEAMAAVAAHTAALTAFLHDGLAGLRHGNGAPVAALYSPRPQQGPGGWGPGQGPIVAFNLKRASGEAVGYAEVEKLGGLHGLQLRTGCFCNPGGCQEALGLSEADVLEQLAAGHVCWDENDLVEGRPTGAVRASFGYMSTWEDAAALLRLVDKYFVSKSVPTPTPTPAAPLPLGGAMAPLAPDALTLGSILLYPIKSCGAMRVEAWPLGPTGLLFDREWALVDAQGQALRLNRLPRMRLIHPAVDLEARVLRVAAPGMPELQVPLTLPGGDVGGGGDAAGPVRDVSVCGEACQGVGYQGTAQAEVDAWLSSFLGRPCALVRAVAPQAGGQRRRAAHQRQRGRGHQQQEEEEEEEEEPAEEDEKKRKNAIGFSNEAQFLLVSQTSVEHLNGLIARQQAQEDGEGEESRGGGSAAAEEYEFRYEVRVYIVSIYAKKTTRGGLTQSTYTHAPACTPTTPQGRRSAERPSFVTVENFRPNLVVAGGVAHQEDLWAAVELLGDEGRAAVRLQVTGPCARCSMVNIDPQKKPQAAGAGDGGGGGGKADAQDAVVAPVLKTLASYRRDKANIYFGQFLVFADDDDGGDGSEYAQATWLRTGMRVRARRRSEEAAAVTEPPQPSVRENN